MKFKSIVKTIFTTYLCILIVCLYASSFIGYTGNNSTLSSSLSNMMYDNNEFRILNNNENMNNYCGEREYFYKDDKYNYYLVCESSENIYVEWTNGNIKSLVDSLNNKEVTINQLISKGLNIYKEVYEK